MQDELAVISLSLLFVALGCQPAWQPPDDGVPKGCASSWSHAVPLHRGLGLSTHLSWGSDEAAVTSREAELAAWAELGVGTARRDLYWSSVEPERGVWDFSGTDLLVDAVEGADAELLGLLVYGNTWACSDCEDSKYPPDDPADYANYAAALVERYGDRVKRWEIWNEPNGGLRFWKPVEDPVAYAELSLAASRAIHAVDPAAEVSLGGLFWPDLLFATPGPEFLDAVLEAEPELVQELDAVSWHPYRYPFTAPELSDDYQPSLIQESCALQEQLAAHGASHLDLWITELGWHTALDALYEGASDEDQAAWLVRSAVLAWAQGSSMYLWYTFRDSGTSDSDQEARFGLYDSAGEAKPAAVAFGVLSTALEEVDTGSIEDRSQLLGLGEDAYAYELRGEEQALWILWTVDEAQQVTVPAAGSVRLIDLDGSERSLDPEREAVSLTIGPTPRLLLTPAGATGLE